MVPNGKDGSDSVLRQWEEMHRPPPPDALPPTSGPQFVRAALASTAGPHFDPSLDFAGISNGKFEEKCSIALLD